MTKTYNFTLILDNEIELSDELEQRVIQANCDDVLLGRIGRLVYLNFDRESESLLEAITSAIQALFEVGIHVQLVEP